MERLAEGGGIRTLSPKGSMGSVLAVLVENHARHFAKMPSILKGVEANAFVFHVCHSRFKNTVVAASPPAHADLYHQGLEQACKTRGS